MPYMWQIAENEDMVKWCLDHGASVVPRISSVASPVPPILEHVAAHGDIATYKLLRAEEALVGRSLNFAFAAACTFLEA